MRDIVDILKSVHAVLDNGHFVGTHGAHLDTYIQKDALAVHPRVASEVGRLFAEKFRDLEVEAIAAPAMGAIVLGQWTAYHLAELQGQEVLSVYADKRVGKVDGADLYFKRGYDKIIDGKKVLVIEDMVTTGRSAKKTVDAAMAVGADVVACGVMINTKPEEVTSDYMGVPFGWLGVMDVAAYTEDRCPMCKENLPINITVGHGKEFLANKKNTNA